jgi:hypothetical protein
MTRSARSRTARGIARPSARAALWFDDQLERRRLLDRDRRGRLAAKDLVDEMRGAPDLLPQGSPVREQRSRLGDFRPMAGHRNPMPVGRSDETITHVERDAGVAHDALHLALDQHLEGDLELLRIGRSGEDHVEAEGARQGLDRPFVGAQARIRRIAEQSDQMCARDDLVDQFHQLRASESATLITPVVLPPGRCRLPTSPAPTGSVPVANTIGMDDVAPRAATAAGDGGA